MKTPAILCTYVVLIFVMLIAWPARSQVLLEDTFDDGDTSGWQTWVSGWIETSGVYRATNTGANIRTESVWASGYNWTDYVAEADIKRPDRAISDAGMVFRYIDDRTFGFCGLNQNNSGKWLSLRHYTNGVGESVNLPFYYLANEFYRVRATADGEKLTCEVVGFPETRIELTRFSSTHGTVGFRNAHIVVDHDNIVVTGLRPPHECVGFYPPMEGGAVTACGNRALPIKAQVFDADGVELTNLEVVSPPVIQVVFHSATGDPPVDVTDEALPVGYGTEGNEFEYNLGDGVWQYNLVTKDYTAAGTYEISMVSGDESEYTISPSCEASFVRRN